MFFLVPFSVCVLSIIDSPCCKVVYFRRHDMETKIREILRPSFKNEYFFINGPVGSGKTRLVIELVRNMMDTEGRRGQGAPIYVTVNQASAGAFK